MLRLLKQLFIEHILSGGVPYIAFHPELGVPIGIFNTKDEPNYHSRVKAIKKMGVKGNKLSYILAFDMGIFLTVLEMKGTQRVHLLVIVVVTPR